MTSSDSVARVTLAPRPPTQPTRKPIPVESLNYVRSIVSTIVKVEGDAMNHTVLTPIYTLLMGSETSDYIRDPAAIWILLELLPYLNHALQMEVWQRLISIVNRSLRNVQMCCTLALVPHCLQLISECQCDNDDAIASRIAEFVGTITSYDLATDELNILLKSLTASKNSWPAHSTKILTAMRMLPRRTVPEIMFNFTGESGSAITIPPLARWPSNPGFTINMWMSLDPRFLLPNYKPFLYWFKTGRGLGYAANISNQCICLETVTGKGQITGKMTKTPSKVERRLEPYTWYMISIVYVYHRMKSCEVMCYINGRLALRQDLAFVNTSEPFDKCYIGSSPRATAETAFCGQISSISLFGDCLTAPTISALHRLGSDYRHAFLHSNEHDTPIPATDQNIIYSGKLANSLIFSYNPKACNGQLSFEVAQNPLYDYFVNSSHAILLDGVETVATRKVQGTLHSLGGIQVLLPLFEQLTSCQDSSPELCSTLLWLFVDLIKCSATCQAYVTTNRTLLVIAHLLHDVPVDYLSEAALDALLSLGRTLADIKHGPLLNSLIGDVLLCTELWVRTPPHIQVKLYSVISTEFVGGAESCDVRASLNVARIIHILQEFYTTEQIQTQGRMLSKEDTISIRAFLLLSAKQSVMKYKVTEIEDISSILCYLVTNTCEHHVVDMLQLLLALTAEHSAVLPRFDELGGVKVLVLLLKQESEAVRIFAIKTLGAYLNACPPKQSNKLLAKSGIFGIIAESLAAKSDVVTVATYNSLFELLIDRISRQSNGDKFMDIDPDSTIKYPQLLEVIAVLLLKQPTLSDTTETEQGNMTACKEYLTSLMLIMQRSRDNRRTLLSQNGWQRWLVSMMMRWMGSGSEGQHVTNLAYSLFQTLLHHALQWEQDGWLVWVETLAILHTYQCEGKGVPLSRAEEGEQYDSCRADDEASITSEPNKMPGMTGELESSEQYNGQENAIIFESNCQEKDIDRNGTIDDDAASQNWAIQEQEEENDEILENIERESIEMEEDVLESESNETEENVESDDNISDNCLHDDKSENKEASDNDTETEDRASNNQQDASEDEPSNHEEEEIESEADYDITEEDNEQSPSSASVDVGGVAKDEVVDISGEDEAKVENDDCLREDETGDNQSDCCNENEETEDKKSDESEASKEIEETSPNVSGKDEGNENNSPGNCEEDDELEVEDDKSDAFESDDKKLGESSIEDGTEGDSSEKEDSEGKLDEDNSHDEVMSDNGTHDESESDDDCSTEDQIEQKILDGGSLEDGLDDNSGEGNDNLGSVDASKASSEPELEHRCTPISEPEIHSHDTEDRSVEDADLPKTSEPVSDSDSAPDVTKKSAPTTGPWPGYPFNPSQWRFSAMPPFKWSLPHQRLLSDLLVALSTTMKLWKSGQRRTSDIVNARDNGVYMTNVAHIISLTADNLVVECGGVGKLVNEITVPGKAAADTYEPVMEFETAYRLVDLLISIVDTVVFSSVLNFNIVENARSLKQGGMLRIALRLVTCYTTINCLKKRQRQKLRRHDMVPEVVEEEINSKLTPLGIVGEPLRLHLLKKLQERHTEELKIDYLLEERDVYYLRGCVMRDIDLYVKESEQQALQVLFYLSVLTVTQYHEIVNTNMSGDCITDQVERALAHVGPLLNDILLDFQGFFAKTILGSHGRELFNDSLSCLKGEVSVVELAMQLCSQEWLSALERHAGVSFTKLLREGRHVASSTDEYLVKLALWSENVAAEAVAEHIVRAAELETSARHVVAGLLGDHQNTMRHLQYQLKQNKQSGEKSWGNVKQFVQQQSPDTLTHFSLDCWEDSSRRRYKMLVNPNGTTHPEAILHTTSRIQEISATQPPNNLVVSQEKLAKGQDHQVPPEEEEEADINIDDNDTETKKGSTLFSEPGLLLLPGRQLTGNLTITKTTGIFSVTESRDHDVTSEETYKFYNVDVSAVFTRRYLHRYRAVEIFTIGHRSWLFVLTDYEAVRRAVTCLPRVGVGLQYGLPNRRQISLAHPKRLLRESAMMDKWRRREISNFDYLMFLNTIAGRSYNDLGQYPVMPWVLKNYTSQTIDLADPNNYRDLSRPIGAQTAERMEKFRAKFELSKEGVAPPFHYGTHYSTPGFVLMWLLRVEPFTTHFLRLQGGKFDHPCRIFSSMAQAWDNCQRDMSDVKELIPELFYLSEMFVNDNKYEMGRDDSDTPLGDVILPPWAKDQDDFLQVHRDALESEYVSCNLHKWIDLIFGVSQRDEGELCNTFYYTTYEGMCDPSCVDDVIIKEALEEQIRSFGQTPAQLLTTPHPARNSMQHVLNNNIKNLNGIVAVLNPVKEHEVTLVKAIVHPTLNTSPVLITVSASQTITSNKFVPSIQNPHQVYVECDQMSPRVIRPPIDPTLSDKPSSYALSPDGKVLFCAGFWDSSAKSFAVESGKLLQSMFGHRDVVTCLCMSETNVSLYAPPSRLADGILVTGSRDGTVCVWEWSGRMERVTGVDGKHASPRSVLTGHVTGVECVSVSGDQGLVVSASRGSQVLLHRVTGEIVRKIRAPSHCQVPSNILISARCDVIVHFSDQSGYLAVFSPSGHLITSQQLQEQLLSMTCDREGNYLITGGFNLTPAVRSVKCLTPLLRLAPCQSPVRVLSLSPDQRHLIAGLTNGTVNVYPVDFRRIMGSQYSEN